MVNKNFNFILCSIPLYSLNSISVGSYTSNGCGEGWTSRDCKALAHKWSNRGRGRPRELSVCLSVCLSICLFVCLSCCLSVCFFVCWSVQYLYRITRVYIIGASTMFTNIYTHIIHLSITFHNSTPAFVSPSVP